MKLRHIREFVRTFGFRGGFRRFRYEVLCRLPWYRWRAAPRPWSHWPSYRDNPGAFFLSPAVRSRYSRVLQTLGVSSDDIRKKADALLRGDLSYFSETVISGSFPPDWHLSVQTGQRFPSQVHWTRIRELSPETGDIKWVWENGRFPFVFPLARAYFWSGDEKYAEAFWRAVEDWIDKNPPQLGPQWKCGQETSLRLFAWIFGFFAFQDAAASTEERKTRLLSCLCVFAERVELTVGYALSQRNNHTISEGVGLWTAGCMLPGHRAAKRWKRKGVAVLLEAIAEQFGQEGDYVQHSFNYQRFVLEILVWGLRVGEVNGEPLPRAVYEAVARCTKFLGAFAGPNGQLPNYGSNDGAQMFPLTDASFSDFRPSLQLASYLTQKTVPFSPSSGDELVWWFFPEVMPPWQHVDKSARSTFFPYSGYFSARGKDSSLFVRAATFRARPAQADNFHIDLQVGALNVFFDPGTYSYNSAPPWRNGLASSRVHNVVTVDGVEQMSRGSRFLWFDWVRTSAQQLKHLPNEDYLQFEHDAYQRLDHPVRQRRAILRWGDVYVVHDRLDSERPHSYRLLWNLLLAPSKDFSQKRESESVVADFALPSGKPYRLHCLSTEAAQWSCHSAAEGDVLAWESRAYGKKTARAALVGLARAERLSFISVLGAQSVTWEQGKSSLEIESDGIRKQVLLGQGTPEAPLLRLSAV